MIYKIINRFTGEWLEWDTLKRGARSVNASERDNLNKPMTETEAAEFADIVARDLVDTDGIVGASGSTCYQVLS